jgi:hypothetical protein
MHKGVLSAAVGPKRRAGICLTAKRNGGMGGVEQVSKQIVFFHFF